MVSREAPIDWREEDWRDLPPARRAGELDAYIRRDRLAGFDLRRTGPVRFHLLRIADDEYRFIWCFHHILIDGWCSSVLLDELNLRYAALTGGKPFRLPPPPPFEEYVAWLGSRDAGKDEAFWRAQLSGLDEPTPLGINRRPLEVLQAHRRGRRVRLPPHGGRDGRGHRLRARQHRVTVNSVLQTAWALVLSEYGGKREVVLGVNVSGRPGEIAGVEKMVGLFVNAVPVRFRLNGETQRAGGGRGHARADAGGQRPLLRQPAADIQRFSEVPAGVPLFFSEYVFENYPLDEAVLAGMPGVTISDFQAVEKTNYPLGLMAAPGARPLQ